MKRTEQSGIRRFFASRLFLILALVVVALIALAYARAYYEDYRVRQQIRDLQEDVKRLGDKKEFELIPLLNYVASREYVEEKARTELNMKAPGEQVAVIKNAVLTSTSQEVEKKSVSKKYLSNPVKWWYYFTHQQVEETP